MPPLSPAPGIAPGFDGLPEPAPPRRLRRYPPLPEPGLPEELPVPDEPEEPLIEPEPEDPMPAPVPPVALDPPTELPPEPLAPAEPPPPELPAPPPPPPPPWAKQLAVPIVTAPAAKIARINEFLYVRMMRNSSVKVRTARIGLPPA